MKNTTLIAKYLYDILTLLWNFLCGERLKVFPERRRLFLDVPAHVVAMCFFHGFERLFMTLFPEIPAFLNIESIITCVVYD